MPSSLISTRKNSLADAQSAQVFIKRGYAKLKLEDYQNACNDYKKATSFGHLGSAKWLNSEGGAWCRNMR